MSADRTDFEAASIRQRTEEGIILILSLMCVAILAMLSLSVLRLADRANDSATAEVQDDVTRQLALSAIDMTYARLIGDPNIIAECRYGPAVPGTCSGADTGDYLLYGLRPGINGAGWFKLTADAITPCTSVASGNPQPSDPTEYTEACVLVEIGVIANNDPAAVFDPTALSVTATARMNCKGSSAGWVNRPDSLLSCTTTRLSSQFRERQAFSFMYFDNFQTLDPRFYEFPDEQKAARRFCLQSFTPRQVLRNQWIVGATPEDDTFNCQEVPYLGSSAGTDVVSGPVHTNDESLLYCGSPVFTSAGLVQSVGSPVFRQVVPSSVLLPVASCDGTPPAPANIRANQPEYRIPVDPSAIGRVALPESSYGPCAGCTPLAANQWLELMFINDTSNPSSVWTGGAVDDDGNWYNWRIADANGAPLTPWRSKSWPGTGVIYVEGNVRVRGKVCLPVSVAAARNAAGLLGQIEINGNLVTANTGRRVAGVNDKVRVASMATRNALAWNDPGLTWDDALATSCPVPGNAMIGLAADNAVTVVASPTDGQGGASLVSDRGAPNYALGTAPWLRDRYVEAAVVALGRGYPTLPSLSNADPPYSTARSYAASVGDVSLPQGGSFSVDEWYLENNAGAAPSLFFHGAIWSNTRGVYGGFADSTGTLRLSSGFQKGFVYDRRLKSQQPPFLVTASQAAWVRSDVVEQVVR